MNRLQAEIAAAARSVGPEHVGVRGNFELAGRFCIMGKIRARIAVSAEEANGMVWQRRLGCTTFDLNPGPTYDPVYEQINQAIRWNDLGYTWHEIAAKFCGPNWRTAGTPALPRELRDRVDQVLAEAAKNVPASAPSDSSGGAVEEERQLIQV